MMEDNCQVDLETINLTTPELSQEPSDEIGLHSFAVFTSGLPCSKRSDCS